MCSKKRSMSRSSTKGLWRFPNGSLRNVCRDQNAFLTPPRFAEPCAQIGTMLEDMAGIVIGCRETGSN